MTVVPIMEPDESNRAEVLLAIGGMLTGGGVTVEQVEVHLRYRNASGDVRFLQIAGPGPLGTMETP